MTYPSLEDCLDSSVEGAAPLFPALAVLLIVYFIVLGRLWSLAQEEQFYLLWPLVLLLLARSRHVVVWVLLLAGAFVVYRAALFLGGASPNRIYYGPDTHADGLIVGAALAAARIRWPIHFGEWTGKIGLGALVPACLFGWTMDWWAVWGQPLFEIGVALLIGAAVSDTTLARGLGTRPLVWISKRSYSLYLWSGSVLVGTISVIGPGFANHLVALAAVFFIASLSYRFVEQPFRRRRMPAADQHGNPSPAAAVG